MFISQLYLEVDYSRLSYVESSFKRLYKLEIGLQCKFSHSSSSFSPSFPSPSSLSINVLDTFLHYKKHLGANICTVFHLSAKSLDPKIGLRRRKALKMKLWSLSMQRLFQWLWDFSFRLGLGGWRWEFHRALNGAITRSPTALHPSAANIFPDNWLQQWNVPPPTFETQHTVYFPEVSWSRTLPLLSCSPQTFFFPSLPPSLLSPHPPFSSCAPLERVFTWKWHIWPATSVCVTQRWSPPAGWPATPPSTSPPSHPPPISSRSLLYSSRMTEKQTNR